MAYTILVEGDVEGVMDRPIGNTPEVHAECEKWYVDETTLNHHTYDFTVRMKLTFTSRHDTGMHGMPSAALHEQKPNAATSQH